MEPNATYDLGTSPPTEETTTPQPLRDFTIFSNLVPELRLKIWTLALFNNPRIIEILETDSEGFYTPTSNASLLSTCQESRTIALQHYQISFPSKHHPGTTYFNPELDTIYYPSWFWRENDEWPSLTQETISSIHHVAIEPLEWYGSGASGDGDINGFPISEYPNLKTFYHIIRDCSELCWCSMGDILPEKGVITFVDVDVCKEDEDNPRRWVNDVIRQFGNIKEKSPGWSVPVFLQGKMRRNGMEAFYTDVDVNKYEEDEENENGEIEGEERERDSEV